MSRRYMFLLLSVCLALCSDLTFAQTQEQKDSLVRLIEANSAQLVQIDSVPYRKIIGPARFLHNDTYLLCDTASWDVKNNIIYALGHVQIIQQNTFLTGESLRYVVDRNIAEFRGSTVQLLDKDGNILRTKFLDYNTKDSTATFYNGGAMRSKEGNIIEGFKGLYDSKGKLFSFNSNVQMYSDSILAKSDSIDYKTDLKKAIFGRNTVAWQEQSLLKANKGYYDRNNEELVFDLDNYIYTEEQEVWADTIKYNRGTENADLYGNVQVTDTVQSVILFADLAKYKKYPMSVELTKNPSIAMYSVENGRADTLFVASDTLKYFTLRYCDIDSSVVSAAKERKKSVEIDALENLRKEVEKSIADKRAQNESGRPISQDSRIVKESMQLMGKETPQSKNIKEANRNAENSKNAEISENVENAKTSELPPNAKLNLQNTDFAKDSLAQIDSLVLNGSLMPNDSLVINDSLAPLDTSAVKFINAWHNVKIYRTDLQGLCDSLIYTGIDSIARFYHDPVMWNDLKNQFTSDTIFVVIKNDSLNKADLVSNAFIISQEDSTHFNQVKSAEMMAYFKNNDIYRYDALGGASAIFYFREDSIITLMNQKEAKILSALIKERKIQKIRYYEQLKSDVTPIYNLPVEKQRLRGFNWREEDRPKTRFDVSVRGVNASERETMSKIKIPDYPYLRFFFPEFSDSVMIYRNQIDSVAREKAALRAERWMEKLRREREARDSMAIGSMERLDSIQRARTHKDTLMYDPEFENRKLSDSLTALSQSVDPNDTAYNISKKELKKEKRLLRKQKRMELKEARKQKRLLNRQRKEDIRNARKESRLERKKVRRESRLNAIHAYIP